MRKYRLAVVNKIFITGNLTKDPDFNTTTKNVPVANFRIASSRKFKSLNGDRKEDVCFVNVTAWMKLAEACKRQLSKGDSVLVEGRLQSKQWTDQQGQNKNTIEILAERIQFLSKEIEEDYQEDDDVIHGEEVE